MEVREDEPVRRDERGRAVREPDGGEAHALEPRRRDVHAVSLLDELRGRVVEGPHSFVGVGGADDEERGQSQELELTH